MPILPFYANAVAERINISRTGIQCHTIPGVVVSDDVFGGDVAQTGNALVLTTNSTLVTIDKPSIVYFILIEETSKEIVIFVTTVFTVTIRDSNNSRCSFLALNNSRYCTTFSNNSRFQLLSSPRSRIDRMPVPCTVAMVDEVLLEIAIRGFHVYRVLAVLLCVQCGPGA